MKYTEVLKTLLNLTQIFNFTLELLIVLKTLIYFTRYNLTLNIYVKFYI